MTDKMKNLAVRTLSGIVLAAVVLGAVAWSPWSFGALLLLLLVGGMHEFYALAEARGDRPQRLIGMVTGAVLFAVNFAFLSGSAGAAGGLRPLLAAGMAFLLLLLPLMLVCELYRRGENPAANVGVTLLGICYVALPLTLMAYIPFVGRYAWNPWTMLFFVFIIWANDVFAYLVGMAFGRHRLFERLSYSWLLDLEARNALNKFLDSLNNIYPSFIDFLGKNPIVDADCISSNDECSHAFVYYEESARFTKEALEDFKEVFSCKIKKYRNECFEFLIDTSLSKSEQRSISKKINVFLEICAGFCSEDIYEKYIDETPFF